MGTMFTQRHFSLKYHVNTRHNNQMVSLAGNNPVLTHIEQLKCHTLSKGQRKTPFGKYGLSNHSHASQYEGGRVPTNA